MSIEEKEKKNAKNSQFPFSQILSYYHIPNVPNAKDTKNQL